MNQSGTQYKQIRVSPRQGSFDFSGNKNIVDFAVPSGNFDLSQSELVVRIQPRYTSTEAVVNGTGDNSGIFQSIIQLNDSANAHYNFASLNRSDALVKNARMESSKLGVMDSVLQHNSFKTNLNAILQNESMQADEITTSALQNSRNKGLTFQQPIALLNKSGTEASEQRSVELKLPLKSVLPANVIDNYQSGVHGDLSYHFELRLDKLVVESAQAPDTFWTANYNNSVNGGNAAAYGALDDIPQNNSGAGINQAEFNTTIQYRSLEDSPFYVGQKLKISFTINAVATVDQVCKIAGLEWLNTNDANNCKIKITFDGYIATIPDTQTMTAITVKSLVPTSNEPEVQAVELKMMEVNNAAMIKMPQTITYEHLNTHLDSYSQTQHQTQNYYIPAMTKACWIVFPEAGADRTWSSDQITNYRILIDNEPITDTKVLYKSAKHYDLLSAAMSTAGAEYQIKNLGSHYKDWNFPEDGSRNIFVDVTVLAFPVKFKNEQQVLNLEIEAGANLSGQIQLVFQKVKQVIVR